MNQLFIEDVTVNSTSIKKWTTLFEVRRYEKGNIQIDYYDVVGATKDATIKVYTRNNTDMYWALVTTVTVSEVSNEDNSVFYEIGSPCKELKIIVTLNNVTSFKLRSSIAIG